MRAWQLIGHVGVFVATLGLACNGTSLGGTTCLDPNNCENRNPTPMAE